MGMLGVGVKAGAAALATVLGLTLAVPSAAAATPATSRAAAGSCTLTIDELLGLDNYKVEVNCTDGWVTGFTLYGSDPIWDDYLTRVNGTWAIVGGDALNEDIGERDEIYAKVDYTTWAGQRKNRKSNRVDGYFGCVLPIQC